jgi:hypothetical protein
VHEVDSKLFAITDDIDASTFLFAQPFESGSLFAML